MGMIHADKATFRSARYELGVAIPAAEIRHHADQLQLATYSSSEVAARYHVAGTSTHLIPSPTRRYATLGVPMMASY